MSESYLAKRLRECRNEKGLTIAAVGSVIGRSESGVGSWERGRTEPDHDTLMKLSELYEVDIASFFERGHRDISLSVAEYDLVLDYREMSERNRELLKGIAGTVLEIQYKDVGERDD